MHQASYQLLDHRIVLEPCHGIHHPGGHLPVLLEARIRPEPIVELNLLITPWSATCVSWTSASGISSIGPPPNPFPTTSLDAALTPSTANLIVLP